MDVEEDEDEDEDDHEEQEKGRIENAMIADNLAAMLSQEHSGSYSCTDYLSMTAWQPTDIYQLMKKTTTDFEKATSSSSRQTVGNSRIDEYCREQIVEWSFRVVDYFRIDREVVAVSLSFLDRFLATCRCDRTSFKLAATTTLHLAVKLLYPCKLADLGILSDLSRGEFDMTDVSEMETHVLQSLAWKLHPPTSIAFASIFLDYFFSSSSTTSKNSNHHLTLSLADFDDVYDVSSFFSELAVCDYFFVSMRASTIALASILNALEGMFGPENHVAHEVMTAATHIALGQHQDLPAARNRLWELYERSEECALHNDKLGSGVDGDMDRQAAGGANNWHGSIFVKKTTNTLSPVSVASKPCHSATECIFSNHSNKLRNESW
jgi:Cyclin, N-terminal domain/Cyclin, C-terminal domain